MKKANGITLISLIITIIVLIILATITIKTIYDTNMIESAANAAEKYEKEQVREGEIISDIDQKIQDIAKEQNDGGENQGKDATATAGEILEGFTAYTKDGLTTGTMPARGTLDWNESNATYTVPEGYYSGGVLDSRKSYQDGYEAGKDSTIVGGLWRATLTTWGNWESGAEIRTARLH